MSLQDRIASTMRRIPTMMATTGLQYALPTSPPGATKPTWGPFTALAGYLQEVTRSQPYDDPNAKRMVTRVSHLMVSDHVTLPEGTLVAINGSNPFWTVNSQLDSHKVGVGVIGYVCKREEPLYLDAQRGGGR